MTANINVTIVANTATAQDIGSTSYALNESIALAALTAGAGLNQANYVWCDTRTVVAGGSDVINMDAPSARDALGQTLALTKIKALYVRNRSTVSTDILKVGGEGSTDAWNSPFDGVDTSKLSLEPDGKLVLIAPSAAGWAVANPGNFKLKIANPGSADINYDIIIIGA